MDVVRPAFVPDPSLSRKEMEAVQHDIAEAAVFADDLALDPSRLDADTGRPLPLPNRRHWRPTSTDRS
jgi:deoxyribonuclease V